MDTRPRYTMYIDEFGHSTIDKKNLWLDENRYLTVTGVIVPRFKSKSLEQSMSLLKTRHIIAPTQYFHRSEIESPKNKGPFAHLRPDHTASDPFASRDAFYQDLIANLLAWDYHVVSIFIDKPFYLKTHTEDTYCFCMRVLLDRFIWLLEQTGGRGDFVYEKRDSLKTSVSPSSKDKQLEEAFTDLLLTGTKYRTPHQLRTFLSSTTLRPRRKIDNIPGLQIADFMAYASFFDMLGIDSTGVYPYKVYDRSSGTLTSIRLKELSQEIIKKVLPHKYYVRRPGRNPNGSGRVIVKQDAYK